MKSRRRPAKSGRTHQILATFSETEWRRYVYTGTLRERQKDSSLIARLLQHDHIEMRADPEDTRRSQYRLVVNTHTQVMPHVTPGIAGSDGQSASSGRRTR